MISMQLQAISYIKKEISCVTTRINIKNPMWASTTKIRPSGTVITEINRKSFQLPGPYPPGGGG